MDMDNEAQRDGTEGRRAKNRMSAAPPAQPLGCTGGVGPEGRGWANSFGTDYGHCRSSALGTDYGHCHCRSSALGTDYGHCDIVIAEAPRWVLNTVPNVVTLIILITIITRRRTTTTMRAGREGAAGRGCVPKARAQLCQRSLSARRRSSCSRSFWRGVFASIDTCMHTHAHTHTHTHTHVYIHTYVCIRTYAWCIRTMFNQFFQRSMKLNKARFKVFL